MLSAKAILCALTAALCFAALALSGCTAPGETEAPNSSPSSAETGPSTQSSQSYPADEEAAQTQNISSTMEATTEAPIMYISANGNRFEVELESNSSATALTNALESGPIKVLASDYGSFEKVGDLGISLPTNDEWITTKPGDVILYQGDKITVYYDVNSWNFTKLGRIKDAQGIKEQLGPGDVELTLSLS